VRWTFNHALAARRHQYQKTGQGLSYGESSAKLTQWKKEYPFLQNVSCVPLQQSLRHLQRAYVNFFEGRARYPTFKSRRARQSAEFTRSAFSWDQQNESLSLAKIGRLRVRWSRVIKELPSAVTITKDCAGRWFVTLTLEEFRARLPETTASVGIDWA
jgi:putative transposase